MSLDTEVKEQWVTALRSGDFKQGRGCLREFAGDEARHCCLGVLAEIRPEIKLSESGTPVYDENDFDDQGHLPDDYLKVIGLLPEEQSELINMNDGDYDPCLEASTGTGKSFAEIADFIEQTL